MTVISYPQLFFTLLPAPTTLCIVLMSFLQYSPFFYALFNKNVKLPEIRGRGQRCMRQFCKEKTKDIRIYKNI